MTRAALLAVTVVALVTAPASGAVSAPVVSFRIAAMPQNLGSTSSCRDGLTRTRTTAGTSTLCVLRASKTDRDGYVIGSVTEDVLETDSLRGGTVVSRATYVFRWVARDGSLARVSIRGRIVRGTGRYAGARGTITGAGLQRWGRQQLAVSLRLR